MAVEAVSATKSVTIAGFARLSLTTFAVSLFFAHLLQGFQIPLIGHVRGKVRKGAFAGEDTLHRLAVNLWAWVGLVRELASHFRQTVDSQVHRDVVDALKTGGGLTPRDVLENEVVELMHQNTQLVLIAQRAHEFGVVEQLKLLSVGVDAHASRRQRSRRSLVHAP